MRIVLAWTFIFCTVLVQQIAALPRQLLSDDSGSEIAEAFQPVGESKSGLQKLDNTHRHTGMGRVHHKTAAASVGAEVAKEAARSTRKAVANTAANMDNSKHY